MIKKIIYINLIFSFALTQSSLLSISGFGEKLESFDAASISLGDSKFFSANSKSISFSSPSSLWRTDFANLYISGIINKINIGEDKNELKENHLNIISFSFPVGRNKIGSFGFSPMFRGNTTIAEQDLNFVGADQSPDARPFAYNTTYEFTGGISELFGIFSMKVSDNVSLGLRISKLFGNSYYRYALSLYDVNINQDESVSYSLTDSSYGNFKQRYSSDSRTIEFRYFNDKFDIVTSFMKANSLKIKLTPEYNTTGESTSEVYFINKAINEYGLGLKYFLNEKSGLTFEFHKSDNFDSFDFLNIFKKNNPKIISNHIGIYHGKKINKDNNLNQFNIRAGIYSKKYQFYNTSIKDSGFTLGFGFEYNENMNMIDVGFVVGSRNSEYVSIDREKYYRFVFSITSSEKWFDRKEE